jgi:hypothetical protein
VDWVTLAGVGSYRSGEVNVGVLRNPPRAGRTATIVIGEIRWTVIPDY